MSIFTVPSGPAGPTGPTGPAGTNLATGAKVGNNGAINVPTPGGVVLTWDTEFWDPNGFHDNVTNNERLTVPAASGNGKYLVVCQGEFALGGGTPYAVLLDIRLDGGLVKRASWDASVNGSTFLQVSGIFEANVGQFFTVRAEHFSTTNPLQFGGGAGQQEVMSFSIQKIAD